MIRDEDGRPATPGGDPYDERYFRETFRPGDSLQNRVAVAWYARLAARCLKETGGRRVLEIGCGYGAILAALGPAFDRLGIDVSEHAIAEARRRTPEARFEVADIEQGVPAGLVGDLAGGFDLVLARYVFEHLRDPAGTLVRIAGLIRPGGTLLYAVPYTGSLGARWKGPRWYALGDPTHCSLLDRDTWLELTRAAGLAIVGESADGFWDLPYLAGIPRWLQAPVFLAPTVLACLSGRALLPARWGENIIVFARRPG